MSLDIIISGFVFQKQMICYDLMKEIGSKDSVSNSERARSKKRGNLDD